VLCLGFSGAALRPGASALGASALGGSALGGSALGGSAPETTSPAPRRATSGALLPPPGLPRGPPGWARHGDHWEYDGLGMVSEAPHGALGASGPRAPVPEVRGAVASPDDALPLRLALARGSLGIELNRPEGVGPLEVRELAFSLPDLRYPLDPSKGVKQFRSRRGRLQRLVLVLPLAALAAWLER